MTVQRTCHKQDGQKETEDKCPVPAFYALLTNGRKQKAQEIKHSLSRTLKELKNEKLGLTTKEMFRNLVEVLPSTREIQE